MPPKRAVELLKEWKDENPHLAYPNDKQSKACAALLSDDVVSTKITFSTTSTAFRR